MFQRSRRPFSHRRTTAVAAAALAASVTLAACGSSGSSSGGSKTSANSQSSSGKGLKSVTVAYVPLPLFEPLFVAMHDGYFAKNGLDVHLTVVQSGQSATTLAATNRVQAVLGGFSAGMFNALNSGLKFQVVGSMAEEAPGTAANGLVVASSEKGKVKNAGGLKGMKIAVDGGAGSTAAYLVAEALAPYHVSLSQVTLVNLAFPEMQNALKTGAVQAAYMSTPFLGAATSAGDGYLVAGAPVGVAATGLIYGGSFASSSEAQPFFNALVQAAKQLQGKAANSTANLQIVAKATGESMKLLQAEPINVFDPKLAPPTASLQKMQQVFMENKNLNYSKLLPSSQYVNSTFSSKAP